MSVDPRPHVRTTGEGVVVSGWRCIDCDLPVLQPMPRCPDCRGTLRETTFADSGVVFASTVMRVGVPGYEPPYGIAYLVLDDGPRVFVHTDGPDPMPPGARARLAGLNAAGDLVAREAS